MRHFDLIIIGAGSGNTIVDERFEDQDVAIIEEGLFGGTCLNAGCIPTKMLVHPADLARQAEHAGDLGLTTRFEGVDWPAVRDRIFGRIDPIAADGKRFRQHAENVTVFDGRCRFVGERRLSIEPDAEEITGEHVVIAAGSRAVVPDIPGLAEVPHHTSDTVMRIDALPERMAILGGGLIGAEFAHVFSALGVEVTQVHRGQRLLRGQDEDVSARFTELAGRQWGVRLDTRLSRVHDEGGRRVLTLDDGERLVVDTLLVATGRRPNSDLLDLSRAGVLTDEDGVVIVDDQQRTSAPQVWALGDVANHHQLKHVANHEARVVQHNLLHPEAPITARRHAVPGAVFSSPQIASVGMTEQEARRSGTSYAVGRCDYGEVAYGWALEDRTSFVKVLVAPRTGLLLGAHLIGPGASMLIQPLVQAMSLGRTAAEVATGQYWIHPALTEVVENALLRCLTG